MESFGDRLRKAREAQGVTREAIAGATHIRLRYLEALEQSDLEKLPGGVFDRGYIRSTAQFLGIDPQPILEAYTSEERQRGRGTPEREQQILGELSRPVEQRGVGKRKNRLYFLPSGGRRPALAMILLGLLATGAWLLLRHKGLLRGVSGPDSPPPATSELATRAGSEEEAPPPASALAAPVDGSGPARPEVEELPPTARRPLSSMPAGSTEHLAEARPASLPGSLSLERNMPGALTLRPAAGESRLHVPEVGVGTGVVDRRLVGASDRFSEGTPVIFWTRVVGGKGGEVLSHLWLYQGRTMMHARLKIGGPHWRTYSRYTLPPGSEGPWRVEARTAEGVVLAHKDFVCLPPGGGPSPRRR